MGKTSTEAQRSSRIAQLRKRPKKMNLLPPPLEFWNDVTQLEFHPSGSEVRGGFKGKAGGGWQEKTQVRSLSYKSGAGESSKPVFVD